MKLNEVAHGAVGARVRRLASPKTDVSDRSATAADVQEDYPTTSSNRELGRLDVRDVVSCGEKKTKVFVQTMSSRTTNFAIKIQITMPTRRRRRTIKLIKTMVKRTRKQNSIKYVRVIGWWSLMVSQCPRLTQILPDERFAALQSAEPLGFRRRRLRDRRVD